MEKIRSKIGLRKFYEELPEEVQNYFGELAALMSGKFSLEVMLAYIFARIESGHVNALYCGAVKLHQVDAGLARRAVQQFQMTRPGFREKFAKIYDKPIPEQNLKLLIFAEGVRDSVLHGKGGNPEQIRDAVAHALEYARLLNEHCQTLCCPAPFGKLQGFKGAGKSLGKKTSNWVLLGMGFFAQNTGKNSKVSAAANIMANGDRTEEGAF